MPGAEAATVLPFRSLIDGDVVAHRHAVGAVALVELEDLLGRDAVGVPGDPGLDRRRRALDVARRDGEMAVLLRDLLDRHVEAVLLEDAGLLRERQRRKAGPARNADADLDVVGERRCGHHEGNDCRNDFRATHDCLPLAYRLNPVDLCISRGGLPHEPCCTNHVVWITLHELCRTRHSLSLPRNGRQDGECRRDKAVAPRLAFARCAMCNGRSRDRARRWRCPAQPPCDCPQQRR